MIFQRGKLSTREREILRALVAGQSNPEIASLLFISENTVKSHVSKVYLKLGVGNRAEAAAVAVREGLAQ